MDTIASQPFRFLDLPKELLLMVYERLIALRLQCIRFEEHRYVNRLRNALGYIITYDPIPPIYLANRTVHAEAAPFMQRLAHTELVPRIILNPDSKDHLAQSVRFIEHLFLLTKETYSRGAIPADEVRYFGYTFTKQCSETVRLAIVRFGRLISKQLFDVDIPLDLPGVHIALANHQLSNEDVRDFMSSCAQLKFSLGWSLTVLITVYDVMRPQRNGVEDQGKVHDGGIIDEKTWGGIGFDASAEVGAVIKRTPSTRSTRDDVSHRGAKEEAMMRQAARRLKRAPEQ